MLSILGALLLLSAWLTQQFLFDKWAERVATIDRAQSDFYTYQSNNSLFNVLFEIASPSKRTSLRHFQTRNYQFGLTHLRKALSEERLKKLDNKIAQKTREMSYLKDLASIQAELEIIQDEFEKEKEDIEQSKHSAQKVFWLLYLLGSTTMLLGNLLPADVDELEFSSGE